MRELIFTACYWIHLIATVIWIGGITFILFIAIPASKQVLREESSKLMGEISKRFTPLVNYSIILLVITGIAMTGLNKQFSGIENFINNWTSVLILKHFLVMGMVAIHIYRGLVLTPKIGKIDLAPIFWTTS
jgi:uncharacterized membrane protein